MSYVRTSGRKDPVENANAENTVGGATGGGPASQYDTFANGDAAISQAITITKRCMIIVFAATVITSNLPTGTQIQRGGVNKTTETTVSAINFAVLGKYGHLQYAAEVLEPGTYTYNLVNTTGVAASFYGSFMKIVAVSPS